MSQLVSERIPSATDQQVSAFKRLQREDSRGPSWLRSIQHAAISRFVELGFPTSRHEEWKYTNVAPIARFPFRPITAYAPDGLTAKTLEPFLFGQPEWNRLVFVNGVYAEELSFVRRLPGGVRLGSLADPQVVGDRLVEEHLTRYAAFEQNPFTALNTAFLRDGAFLYMPAGRVIVEPVHLLHISMPSDAGTVSQPRNLIVLDSGAMAAVVESYVSLGDELHLRRQPAGQVARPVAGQSANWRIPRAQRLSNRRGSAHSPRGLPRRAQEHDRTGAGAPTWERSHLTNAVTEVFLADGAVLDHYKVQTENREAFHVAATHVHQERGSTCTSCAFKMGAQLARDDLNVVFNGEGCDATLNGLYLVTGRQHLDTHTLIDHAKPQCTSFELYRGILDEQGRGVFNGKILVRQDAQKTDAKQLNQNLLLSGDAEVDTKPQLEIYADDVKCTHGATAGQLEEEEIFYLQSRGLSRETAGALLTYGFASEVIRLVKSEPIRSYLDDLVAQRFRGQEAI